MSYEKVKAVTIKDNKVFVNGASNNVRPLNYQVWECLPLTKTLQERGKDELDLEILKAYEGGEFQGGNNKYTKALKVLTYLFAEEYKKFDWRNGGEEYEQAKINRETEEFNILLKKALNTKIPKEKFIITKDIHEEKVFGKRCLTCMKWTRYKEKATKYDFEKEAEDNVFKEFKGVWKVEVTED
jgi:hypothetical protein